MSLVFGVLPVAKRISSTVMRLPSSRLTTTGSDGPPRFSWVTVTPVRTSTPASVRPRLTNSPTNGSIRGNSAESRTNRVTSDPRPRQAVAISTPTPPAPTTAKRAGTVLLSVALRLVQGAASATPGMSGTVAVLPVHTTTAWRAVRTTSRSSAVATATRRGPSMRAWPRITSTPIATTASACPLSFQLVTYRSRRPKTPAGAISPTTASRAPSTLSASSMAITGRSRDLLGTQPQYEHSPPTSSRSTTATDSPAAPQRATTFCPTGPAPRTITS